MAYDSYAQNAPAPMLAALGVEVKTEQVTESSVSLDEKERLELREILRLSIGDRVSEYSEEDLNDLGMTMLELTAIALKAMHSEKSTV